MSLLRRIHRWLGLALAAIVLLVAASGALLLFREPYYRSAYPAMAAPVTPAQVAARASVLRAIEVRWTREEVRLVKFPRPGANAYHVWLRDGTEAFVDPRNGAVIDRWAWYERLPAFLFELHAHLLGGRSATVINGIAALALGFMSLTGLLLWWPARRGAFRLRGLVPHRLSPGSILKSHAATGALAALPILLFAATGAAIVFYEPVATAMSRMFDERAPQEPNSRIAPTLAPVRSWTTILAALDATFPDGETVFYNAPSPANARLTFRKRLPGEWHPNGRSYVSIDPYTGRVAEAIDARTQGVGTRLMHAIYPVHSAKVGGAPMVLIALAAALASVWLAVGGVWSYVWRRLKARTAQDRVPALSLVQPGERPAHLLPLADVPTGVTARLSGARLDAESRALLRALGLTDASVLRVCKQGEPCVVQVRATRIGMSRRIARNVYVVAANADDSEMTPWR